MSIIADNFIADWEVVKKMFMISCGIRFLLVSTGRIWLRKRCSFLQFLLTYV